MCLDNEASPKLQSLTMLKKGAEFTKVYWKHTIKTGSFSLSPLPPRRRNKMLNQLSNFFKKEVRKKWKYGKNER